MKAIRLQTEYMTNPIGIDVQHPRLFWNCSEGVRQTAYEVQAVNAAGETCFESGVIASGDMHMKYPLELHSRDRITWKVRLYDEKNEPGEWSDPAWFEMGLLEESDWSASWIRGDYKVKKGVRYPADCFRKFFDIRCIQNVNFDKKVAKARAYISACGLYRFYLNGKDCNTFELAPGHTDYRKRIQYQTIDVTDALISGSNKVELQLADGWYRGSCGANGLTDQYGTRTKVILQLEITYSDGTGDTIVTDDSWQWSNDGAIRFADNKDGETVDAQCTATYSGSAVVDEDNCADIGKLRCSNNVPVTKHEHFTYKVIRTPGGKTVLDFGQNIAGIISFEVQAHAGDKITMRFGEMLDADGEFTQKNIQQVTKKKTTPLQRIDYTCQEGRNAYENHFSIFGFQYVLLETDLSLDAFQRLEAIALYSDFEQIGFFECSNELINQFVHCTIWSTKGNSADLPTDCPTRERHGWSGDAQIFYQTAAYLFNYAPFARKYIRDMTDWQTKDGNMPHIAPEGGADAFMRTMNGSSGWADASVFIPYRQWKLYGDERILRDNYNAMRRFTEFNLRRMGRVTPLSSPLHMRREDRRYIVNYGQSYGEWAEPAEFGGFDWKNFVQPHPEVSTAYLYLQLQYMSEIARAIGKVRDAKKYAELSENVKTAYQKLRETDSYPMDTKFQAQLVRPLYMGLFDGSSKKEEAQEILLKDLEEFGWRIGTGFLSTPLILYVLEEMDLSYAYRLLENEQAPGWLVMPKSGATTVWESWEGDTSVGNIDSRNHYSKGAVCQWLFEEMCGVNIDGERHFRIAPKPGGSETHASFRYNSIYGEVSSAWKRTEEGTQYTIKIPSNCEAEICLPGEEMQRVGAGEYTYLVVK